MKYLFKVCIFVCLAWLCSGDSFVWACGESRVHPELGRELDPFHVHWDMLEDPQAVVAFRRRLLDPSQPYSLFRFEQLDLLFPLETVNHLFNRFVADASLARTSLEEDHREEGRRRIILARVEISHKDFLYLVYCAFGDQQISGCFSLTTVNQQMTLKARLLNRIGVRVRGYNDVPVHSIDEAIRVRKLLTDESEGRGPLLPDRPVGTGAVARTRIDR